MTKVLILGANGQLARNTTQVFLETTDVYLTLYLRRASRHRNPDPSRVKIVEGDVFDAVALRGVMRGQDAVYANLAGDMARQARSIIDAMHAEGPKRLIFISSMGIYGEVPDETYRSVLDPYRDSAAEIEKSDLDYTILRPGGSRATRPASAGSPRKANRSRAMKSRSTACPTSSRGSQPRRASTSVAASA
jgi:nucleoside-diphosphate-sugar epimerase